MKRKIITISNNGAVTVPSETKMSIVEIANLFGIYYQTAKQHIRAIEKSGVADGDYLQSCTCKGSKVYPDYYSLEILIAVAFRVQSRNAELFREWVICRITKPCLPQTIILSLQNSMLNKTNTNIFN